MNSFYKQMIDKITHVAMSPEKNDQERRHNIRILSDVIMCIVETNFTSRELQDLNYDLESLCEVMEDEELEQDMQDDLEYESNLNIN